MLQVKTAEAAQKRSEKEMATLLSTTVHNELKKHYEERGKEISALQVTNPIPLVLLQEAVCGEEKHTLLIAMEQ